MTVTHVFPKQNYRLSSAQQTAVGVTTIAHLSDLHFASGSDPNDEVWQSIIEDLSSQRVDLVAVTGDLMDNSVKDHIAGGVLGKIAEYLTQSVCSAIRRLPEEALIVVPGNHDYRLQGFLNRNSVACHQFDKTFGPFFKPLVAPKLKAVFFPFDSNTNDSILNAARGSVKEQDILRCRQLANSIRDDPNSNWELSHKIVLVHHHPMPIGPTETQLQRNLANREELLLFDNAGLFMTELANIPVDLILHGHKHFPFLSKAAFSRDAHMDERFITVIAAGSLGGKIPTYNLIRIYDDGEIMFEERTRELVTFESKASVPIISYEEARNRRFQRLIAAFGVENKDVIQGASWSACMTLAPLSGDAEVYDFFKGVTAFGGATVGSLQGVLQSEYGYHSTIAYKPVKPASQHIEWKWIDPVGSKRSGKAAFDPPIGIEPIDFMRFRKTANSVYFNAMDRKNCLEAQSYQGTSGFKNQKDDVEFSSLWISNVYQRLSMQVAFPEGCFPENSWIEVFDPADKIDRNETEYVLKRFDAFKPTRTLQFIVDRPFPGYKYRICWQLPSKEGYELGLTQEQQDLGAAACRRLLRVNTDKPAQNRLLKSLLELSERLTGEFPAKLGDEVLELKLYVYQESSAQLIPVCTMASDNSNERVWLGQGLGGQACRRREALIYRNREGHEMLWYQVPGQEQLPPPVAALAFPFSCPESIGTRLAVLYVQSSFDTSGLLSIFESDQMKRVIYTMLTRWQIQDLCPIILAQDCGNCSSKEIVQSQLVVTELSPCIKSFRVLPWDQQVIKR